MSLSTEYQRRNYNVIIVGLHDEYHSECLSPTSIISHLVQESDGVEMFGCGHRQRQHIPYGLMEARIGSTTVADRLVFVLKVIFNMAHLVMHGEKLLHGHSGALFDSVRDHTFRYIIYLMVI